MPDLKWGRWRARRRRAGKYIYLGSFPSKAAAAAAERAFDQDHPSGRRTVKEKQVSETHSKELVRSVDHYAATRLFDPKWMAQVRALEEQVQRVERGEATLEAEFGGEFVDFDPDVYRQQRGFYRLPKHLHWMGE